MVRVTSNTGKTSTTDKTTTTSTITKPTFEETDLPPKTVTITYPKGCGTKYTCTYKKNSEEIVNVTNETMQVDYTVSGNLVASISDGINSVSSTYNVVINNGFYNDNDCTYFWENGARAKSWFCRAKGTINPCQSYTPAEAHLKTDYYYFDANGCMLKGGWFKDDTEFATGYICNSEYYYLNEDGKMAVGWKKINNKWYYFAKTDSKENKWLGKSQPQGCMLTGWVYSEDYSCASHGWYFKSDGSLATNTYIGDYYVDSSGCWIQ